MRLTGLTLPILLGALLIQVVTVVMAPRVCPPCLNPCTENPKMECDSDKNCNGTQKCCQDGCLYSCTDPIVIKPGLCPKSSTHYIACSLLTKMKDGNCTGDQDCYGKQKCCPYNYQYQCKDPTMRKPGLCPISPTPSTSCSPLPEMKDGNCTGDQDCIRTQRCCLYNCQYQCKDPVGLRGPPPGDCCSSLMSSIFQSTYFLTKPRVCLPCMQRCLRNLEFVWSDECCNATQKSCLDGCNYLCTEPEVIKPGECPLSPTPPTACSLLPEMEDGNCTGDQHCYGTQKCCQFNCQYQCKYPAVTKPGECRRHYIDPSYCFPRVPEEGCRSDQECDGAKKCCLYDCHYACRDPIV